MATEKSLSEAAQWFLRDFQKTLDDFATEAGVQVIIVNKDGDFVSEIRGVQRVCKLIMATEDGRTRCKDHFKSALPLMTAQKKPVFTECYAGFASVWAPIIIKDRLIGVIISCGGRYDREESREKLEKKFSKLADEIGVMQKEDFIKAAIDEVPLVSKEELKARTERLKELFDILATTAHTPLKEVFG